jgi:hypothetical protein
MASFAQDGVLLAGRSRCVGRGPLSVEGTFQDSEGPRSGFGLSKHEHYPDPVILWDYAGMNKMQMNISPPPQTIKLTEEQ